MTRYGVISDTHIPGRASRVPPAVLSLFEGAGAILHAGDVVSRPVLDELGRVAPVHAVLGNLDHALTGWLPEQLELELEGVRVGMLHDAGPAAGRRRRVRTRFPGCRGVVFGHSHRPLIEDDGDLLLLNPGSACDPRAARVPTVALLDLGGGEPRAELIELP